MAIDMAAAMDGIGACGTAYGLAYVYPYPVRTVVTPCLLVDFPSEIALGTTFTRGSDRMAFPAWYLVGQEFDKATRDALSAVIDNTSDLYAAIEGAHAWGDADVTAAAVATLQVAETTYLGLRLTVEVVK